MSNSESIQEKIWADPRFAEMVSKRTRFAILLSLVVLVPYYSFMMVSALAPTFFASTISENSVITIGWPIAALIVIGAWLLTGVYIQRANGEFDAMNEEILREARK